MKETSTDWAAIKGNTEEKIKRWSKKSGSAGGVGGGGVNI